MMNALLAVIVLGGFCGLTISKRIPFFPGWIGSIGGALACGYFSTGKDSRYYIEPLFVSVTYFTYN
jgi:hypothetical protein